MPNLVLYSFHYSSCSWRVRVALHHKGIPYTLKPVNIQQGEQHRPEYLKINPSGQVPAMVVDGKPLVDSIAIIEYLEEAYPQNPLMPKDLFQRAKVRHICEYISSGIQPLQSPLVAAKYSSDPAKQTEWLQFYINKGFTALEKILNECSGKYCVGNELTTADLCLVPQVFNADRRFSVDLKPYPTIRRIYATLLELDAFKLTHPITQPDYPQPKPSKI